LEPIKDAVDSGITEVARRDPGKEEAGGRADAKLRVSSVQL